ncbi:MULTISPECIES: glucose 1-dehydrogenase [Sphingobium]|uniref:glucose 1-dehydrogenase n=1 Tax=Sphingobium TaxID=165695 RepID=UPI00159C86ED|nr:glucose 1-dehydrogenase [Sphingobium sp. 15-1]
MGKLSGKNAVITGGSSGIGLASAKLFVEEGARVFITSRRQEELDRAVSTIGGAITAIRADVASMPDLDRLYETVGNAGRIDILFANAGVGDIAPMAEVDEAHVDKIFGVNVKGVIFSVQKALPLFNDGGSIIFTGSVAGTKATPTFGIYGASKAAVRNLARTLTLELKDRGIRVNVLSPGPTDTPIFQHHSPETIARLVASIPIGRLGRSEEIAKAALFLASDDSSFIAGVELFADGGRAQI